MHFDAKGQLWKDAIKLPPCHFDANGGRRATTAPTDASRPMHLPLIHQQLTCLKKKRKPTSTAAVTTLTEEMKRMDHKQTQLLQHVRILTATNQFLVQENKREAQEKQCLLGEKDRLLRENARLREEVEFWKATS